MLTSCEWLNNLRKSCAALLLPLAGVAVLAAAEPQPANPYGSLPGGINGDRQKLYLTLRDVVQQALQQNLDISIDRLNPAIAAADVLAAEGAFDINWKTSMTEKESSRPSSLAPLTSGVFVPSAGLNTVEYNFQSGFNGKTPIGTTYNIGMTVDRLKSSTATSTNNTFQWSTFVGIDLRQPLLNGFGWDFNTAQIRINRKNQAISYQQFVTKVMEVINTVEQSYYDVIYDIENVRVKEQSLDLAKRFLEESRKRMEVGTLAKLDLVQAEAEVAQREGDLIDAKRVFDERQNAFKQLINHDVIAMRNALVVPVDKPTIVAMPIDALDRIRLGFENRPEYVQRKIELERSHIFVKFYQNALLPQVDLTGSFGYNAVGGAIARRGAGHRDFGLLQDNTDSIAAGSFPTWSGGVVVTVPLGNDTARGNYRHYKLAAEQSLLNLKKIEQDIIVSVDQSAIEAQAKAKLIDAFHAATRLQQEALRAEEEKLKAGTSTTFVVLRVQRDLTDARVRELRAIADYNKSLVELTFRDGTILKQAGVSVEPEVKR